MPFDTVMHTKDDDLDKLLALVDELYASPGTAGARDARERRHHASSHRQELRAQVEQLQRTLDAMRCGFDPHEEIDVARLWARISGRQRKQREIIEQQNATLKRVVRRQQALARRVVALVDELQLMLQHAKPRTQTFGFAGPCSAIPALFVRRLDSVCERVAARAIQITSSDTRDHESRLNDAHTGVYYRFRSRGHYPFKLSSVTDAFWSVFHEQTPTAPLAHDEVYHANATFQLDKPFGWLEVQGPSATRRVYMQDGSVVLVGVSIVAGTKSEEKENLMAGLEMHETVCVRLLRTDGSNPRSPVFAESVTETEVFATRGLNGHSDDKDHCGQTSRLQRFRDFIETYAVEDRGQGRQKLENRLLDASLARDRADSLL